ncbi:MAG: hypothetical protein ABIO94_01985 [Opitutaceae bacterium]
MKLTRLDIASIAAAVAVFAVVGGVAHGRLEEKRAAVALAAERQAGAIVRLREENAARKRELDDRLAEAEARVRAGTKSRSEAVRRDALLVLAKMHRQRLVVASPDIRAEIAEASSWSGEPTPPALDARRLRPNVFAASADGRLAETFAEVFGLSEAQFAELQEAAMATRRQMDEMILKSATVRLEPDGSVTMTVKTPAQMKALLDQLRTTLQQTLGPEMFAAFETLQAPDGFERRWRTEAVGDRTIKVRHWQVPRSSYKVDVEFFAAGGRRNGTSSRLGITRPLLVEHLGPLATLLPPEF